MAAVTMGTARRIVLALNAGSSSVKFGVYAVDAGKAETLVEENLDDAAPHGDVFDRVEEALGGRRPDAIGHRIVHGGPDLSGPVRIDEDILARLDRATAFAPLHGRASLALIESAGRRWPDLPQIACFDTGFHAGLPEIAARLPVPRGRETEGVRRYGFHGLSCRSILYQLGGDVPDRLIIAHLGSGASVTAVRGGRSIDTSMGLTPSGGVVMATRTGDIDPGLLLFLMRERGMDAAALEDLVDHRSGLLGLSGLSGDLRRLRALADANADADLAIRAFCRSVAKQIAAMMASLGGADLIVFTGGIGEHDASARATICRDLGWAGVAIEGGGPGTVRVATLPSREGEQMAREAAALLDGGPPDAVARIEPG